MTQDNKIRFICVIDHFQTATAKEMVDKTLFCRNIRQMLLTEFGYLIVYGG